MHGVLHHSKYILIFIYLPIKVSLLCENLVIKALTNLMAHFIFLAPNKLEPLCHLSCICLHLYVGISRTVLSRGTLSTLLDISLVENRLSIRAPNSIRPGFTTNRD